MLPYLIILHLYYIQCLHIYGWIKQHITVLHESIHCMTFSIIFTVRANLWKFHAVKRDFIIDIYRKRARSVKIPCSEITCNLKSVKFHVVNFVCSTLFKPRRIISATRLHVELICPSIIIYKIQVCFWANLKIMLLPPPAHMKEIVVTYIEVSKVYGTYDQWFLSFLK